MSSEELPLGSRSKQPTYSRAQEISQLLTHTQNLIRPFIGAADDDASALAEGHGLQIPGGAPRTVLVEHHPPQKLASLLGLSITPPSPGVQDLISTVSSILRYSVNTSSPGFLDKLYSSPSPPGLAADLLLSALNTNSHVFAVSPALTLIEKFVGKELSSLFDLTGAHAGGVTVPGGAAANTIAMTVARNVRFPAVKDDGLVALPAKPAIFTSEASHYSIATAAQMLGFGRNAVQLVSSKSPDDDAMDPAALEKALERAVEAGDLVLFVSATSGTTVRGAYDDLKAIGEIAHRYGAWFHVDACWGGGAAFSAKLKHKLAGSGSADSIAFNPHKMLGVPLTTSFLLAADLRMFWAANRLEAGYLFHHEAESAAPAVVPPGKDEGIVKGRSVDRLNKDWRNSPWVVGAPRADSITDQAQFVPQCGRRPDALKMYMHWRYYGTEGIAKHVEASFAGAIVVMQLVKESEVLRAIADEKEPPCAQACFYYSGEGGKLGMQKKVTREIVARLVNRGWMTDYAPGKGKDKDEEYLRVVCNRLTTRSVAEGLVRAITEVGSEVVRDLGI